MFEDGKKLYEECANQLIPHWKDLTKSELCNLYVESNSSEQKEGAVSALIYKCWNIFYHNYRAQPYIPLEDWYESMVDAIMYVLDKHVWTDPNNILYGKDNGPEMALHRCIWSRKLNVYSSNNKPKRIINKNIQSLDYLREVAGVDPDNSNTNMQYELDDDYLIFQQYIQLLVAKQKPHYGILLDLITDGIPKNKLALKISKLDDEYVDYFSSRYEVDRDIMKHTLEELKQNRNLGQFIEYCFVCLQRDQDFISYLKG